MHDDPARLRYLLEACKETLPQLPGFRSLSLFGSMAEGCADGYSDIDLIATTDDLPGAKTALLGLLEGIGPIEFCWVMNFRPDEWNPTIVFRNEGYFHKLDLGLTDAQAVEPSIPIGQTTLLIEGQTTPTPAVRECNGYVPQEKSLGHFLLGQYIGCCRYVKARKRGQPLTCYRFAGAAAQRRLAFRYARLTGDPGFRSNLSTWDYQRLDALLSPEDHAALLHGLDFSALATMDAAVRTAMGSMLTDALELAAISGEALPTDVFERISAFVAEELSGPIAVP